MTDQDSRTAGDRMDPGFESSIPEKRPAITSNEAGAYVGGALLVRVEFGDHAALREVHETQSWVRSLLLHLVEHEAGQVELSGFRGLREVQGAFELEFEDEYAQDADPPDRSASEPHPPRKLVAVGTAGGLLRMWDHWNTSAIEVSSSLTVNPWEEIVRVVMVSAGGGALARATWMGLKNANEILNFIIRASTFKIERRTRVAELEAEAFRQRNEVVREFIQASSDSLAARQIIDALGGISAETAQRISITEISAEEADARRRALLHIVRPDGASND